jgi:hypothetical protein
MVLVESQNSSRSQNLRGYRAKACDQVRISE